MGNLAGEIDAACPASVSEPLCEGKTLITVAACTVHSSGIYPELGPEEFPHVSSVVKPSSPIRASKRTNTTILGFKSIQ